MLRWLRSAFVEDIGLKIFAFVLALILYRYVKGDHYRNSAISIKLILKHPKELIQTKSIPPDLKVTLRGPDSQLIKVEKKSIRYTLNLPKADIGSMQYELYTDQLRGLFPIDVRVIRIRPSILNLVFEKLGRRFFQIRPKIKGEPSLGSRLMTPLKPFPDKARVEGPLSFLSELNEILTEPIDITGLSQDTTRFVRLLMPHDSLRLLSDGKVRVKLTFHQIQGSKVFQVSLKMFGFLHPSLQVKMISPMIPITVHGPLAQLHSLQSKDIVAEVDGRELNRRPKGRYFLRVRIRLPVPDLATAKAPSTVEVLLKEKIRGKSDSNIDRKVLKKNKKMYEKGVNTKKMMKQPLRKKKANANNIHTMKENIVHKSVESAKKPNSQKKNVKPK